MSVTKRRVGPPESPRLTKLPPLNLGEALVSSWEQASPVSTRVGSLGASARARPDFQRAWEERHNATIAGPDTAGRRPAGGVAKPCPGAVGWLFAQHKHAEQRSEEWHRSRPATERLLRKTLRHQLRDFSAPRSARARPRPREEEEAWREAQVQRVDHLVTECVREARDKDAPVVLAGRKRLERMKQLLAEGVPPDAPPESDPGVAKPRKDSDEPRVDVSSSSPWSTFASSRSLGIRGLADDGSGFAKLEARSQCTTNAHVANVGALVTYLIEGVAPEEQRAWVIYCWICRHMELTNTPTPNATLQTSSAIDLLRSRLCDSRGVAELFACLCEEAGLTTLMLSGHVRDCSTSRVERAAGESRYLCWNAVFLDGEWQMVDCACGAGLRAEGPFSASFRPYYFGPPQDELAFTHYPLDSPQFAPPVGYEEFCSQPLVNADLFFGQGLTFGKGDQPREDIELEASNTGAVRLQIPGGVRVSASLDGQRQHCFCKPAPTLTRLRVTVVSAKNLRNLDFQGHSDPYCLCQVQGNPEKRFRTRTLNDCASPSWNESWEVSVAPGDALGFRLLDQDQGVTDDDLLGSVTLPTGQFHAGRAFDGALELEEDRCAGSRLHVRVAVLGTEPCDASAEAEIAFRAPRGGPSATRLLELQAGPPEGPSALACAFRVRGPTTRLADFVEPEFPAVELAPFHAHGLAFVDSLPLSSVVLGERDDVELRLVVPRDTQAVAELGGEPVSVRRVRDQFFLRGQSHLGDGDLTISVRRGGGEYVKAVTYQASSPGAGTSILEPT